MSELAKPVVSADEFFAVDIRVGRVLAVEPFPKARNPAWKVTADFGQLGTLSTSAQVTHYAADELLGRMITGVVNLGVKRVAGFRSEFLLLGAVGDDYRVRLLSPDQGATPGESVA